MSNCNPVGNTDGCGYKPEKVPGSTVNFNNLGAVLSEAITLIIYVSFVLMLIMMIAGALQYIFAGGNKDRLGAARKRITFALIGFVLVVIAWLLQGFVHDLFAPKPLNIPKYLN